MPALFNNTRSGTPVQYVFPTAHGPQLNPTDCLIKFCSFRRFPAHTIKHGNVSAGIFDNSSMPMAYGFGTFPHTSIECVSHDNLGTAP
jgi:hypothetical protein